MLNMLWPLLVLVLPLPLVVRWLIPPVKTNGSAAMKIPFYQAVANESATVSGSARGWTMCLSILIWCLLILAATRPQWTGDPIDIPVAGRDLMLAVDVSGSMRENDMVVDNRRVNRLVAVKKVASDFVRRRKGDRVGLILFGSRAYLQTPLTLDRETVITLLKESEIGIAGKRTAIGDAIGLAVKRLRVRAREKSNRVLILLTDGANTAGELPPDRAAGIAQEEGITIYTIGVGSERQATGLMGSLSFNSSMGIDEKTLQQIAQLTGGQYFRAHNTTGLEAIYKKLDELEPIEDDDKQFRPVSELFIWPLGLALLMSFILAAIFLSISLSRSHSTRVDDAVPEAIRA